MKWLLVIFFATNLFATERTPRILTTSAIIEMYDDQEHFLGIVLIEKEKLPFKKLMPGGHVEYWESVEDAVRREMLEEVHLELKNLRQFHVYSNPARDPNEHSVEVTFIARGVGSIQAGDDADKASIVSLDQIPWDQMAYDHGIIVRDYVLSRNQN